MPDSTPNAHALWRPFTQMSQWAASDNLTIVQGDGHWLIDAAGNRYLDGVSSLWVNTFGHRRPEIDAAIRGQLDRIAQTTLLGLESGPAADLAEALVRIAPKNLHHVFLASDGASAVEAALKMALLYWRQRRRNPQPQKTVFLSFRGAYHGDTLGAVAVGNMPLFHGPLRPVLETTRLDYPNAWRCDDQAPDFFERMCVVMEHTLAAESHRLAAVIVEPLIQAAAGMVTMAPGYLRRLRAACTRHDVLLITDEVATGFGKTGAMFACDREDVSPDLLVVGKGLSGGYLPVSATLASDAVYASFLGEHDEFRTFFHGHSFAGNALGCAAALANLKIFESDRILEKLSAKIAALQEQLCRFALLPHVGDVRQCGVMVGIELVQDPDTRTPWPAAAQIGHRVTLAARRRGVILRPLGSVIVLMPPLSITGSELTFLTDTAYEAIREVTGD